MSERRSLRARWRNGRGAPSFRSRWDARQCRLGLSRLPSAVCGQAGGLVLDEQGLLLQGGHVATAVVAAEEQFAGGQDDPDECLGAAGVAAVSSRASGGLAAGVGVGIGAVTGAVTGVPVVFMAL